MQRLLAFIILLFSSLCVRADWGVNMPVGVTPISRDVYDLHMTVFWVCVGIAVIVFGILTYALIKHRKSKGVQAAQFSENKTLEIVWAIIPFIILIGLAIPATKVLFRMNDESASDITIKVTGYQWKWKYEYLDQGISFFSNISTPQDQLANQAEKGEHYLLEVDHPLVLPVHKKIRFLITASDVIHSWYVPALGIKRDALPGFINEAWARIDTPGTYRGQCAELCGTNHGYMPIVVVAMTEADFAKWVAQQNGKLASTATTAVVTKKLTKDELMTQGKLVYDKTCAVCHKPDGTGMPPAFPAMKGSKIAMGPIAAHIDIVLNGKPGTAMQAFGTQLSDEDIASVITYERNAFGNNMNDLVQPADIAAAKNKK
jgi:cytochrome c oxidase subunit II